MIATEAQREAIDSLLTFIEEATSLRQTAARHLSRCGRLLRLPELEAAVPGLVAGDPTGADADLVCRIEKLEMPPCPPIPESLAPYATGDWRAPEWTPDWKALPDPAEHPESAELYETLADWLRIRGSWLEARGEILPNHALFERLQDLRDHLSESNLRDECVIGTALFTSNPDVTRAKNPVRWPLLVQPLVIELGSSRRNLPVIEVRRNGDEDPRLRAEILAPFAEDGVDLKAAGVGYTLFVIAMAIARLMGDRMVERFGRARVLVTGMLLNIGTLVAMVLTDSPVVLFASLFVMGLGIANIAPVLISAASSVKGCDPTAAITTVTTIGYGGLMAGPALLGFIAQHKSLETAFLFIAALLMMALLNEIRVSRQLTAKS